MIELISSPISIITIATLVTAIIAFAGRTPMGAASLPVLMMLIALVNFFIMPVMALANGDPGFFGMYITTLEWAHLAVFLYCIGALLACAIFIRNLKIDVTQTRIDERPISNIVYIFMVGVCVIALTIHVGLGRLNISASENYEFASDVSDYAFLNLFFTAMIPLTIIFVIKEDFSKKSIFVVFIILLLFLQIAFRYRIMLLGFGLGVAFCLTRKITIRLGYTVFGMLLALLLSNLIVNTRKYGGGLDFSNIKDMHFVDLLTSFGGEIGPIYVMYYTTSTPLPDLIGVTPWLIAISRLVPSFLWPNKPSPEYLQYFTAGFSVSDADKAGIAAPQHVEMLMQFGWAGLPFIAFLYYAIACLLVKQFNGLGKEGRITGCALIPAFFGFYMQNRGYFFQSLSDGLFLFGPVFLLYMGQNSARVKTYNSNYY